MNKMSCIYDSFFASQGQKWALYIFYPVSMAIVSLFTGNLGITLMCMIMYFTLEFSQAYNNYGGIFDKSTANAEFIKSAPDGTRMLKTIILADFIRRLASTAFAVFFIFLGCLDQIAILDIIMITGFVVAISEITIYFITKSARPEKFLAFIYLTYVVIALYVVIYHFLEYKLPLLFVTLFISVGLIYLKFRLIEKKVGELYND